MIHTFLFRYSQDPMFNSCASGKRAIPSCYQRLYTYFACYIEGTGCHAAGLPTHVSKPNVLLQTLPHFRHPFFPSRKFVHRLRFSTFPLSYLYLSFPTRHSHYPPLWSLSSGTSYSCSKSRITELMADDVPPSSTLSPTATASEHGGNTEAPHDTDTNKPATCLCKDFTERLAKLETQVMEMYLWNEVAGEEKLEALKAISGHLDVIARMLSGVAEPAN